MLIIVGFFKNPIKTQLNQYIISYSINNSKRKAFVNLDNIPVFCSFWRKNKHLRFTKYETEVFRLSFGLSQEGFCFFVLVLTGVELAVVAFLCHKFLVASAFDNLSVLDNEDYIRVSDGGKSVCDDNRCPAARHGVDSRLYLLFGEGVDRCGRLIENEDFGV